MRQWLKCNLRQKLKANNLPTFYNQSSSLTMLVQICPQWRNMLQLLLLVISYCQCCFCFPFSYVLHFQKSFLKSALKVIFLLSTTLLLLWIAEKREKLEVQEKMKIEDFVIIVFVVLFCHVAGLKSTKLTNFSHSYFGSLAVFFWREKIIWFVFSLVNCFVVIMYRAVKEKRILIME